MVTSLKIVNTIVHSSKLLTVHFRVIIYNCRAIIRLITDAEWKLYEVGRHFDN